MVKSEFNSEADGKSRTPYRLEMLRYRFTKLSGDRQTCRFSHSSENSRNIEDNLAVEPVANLCSLAFGTGDEFLRCGSVFCPPSFV